MASRTQLRNASLHVRLTQVLRDLVHRTIGEAQATSPVQKIVSDNQAKVPELQSQLSSKSSVEQEAKSSPPQEPLPTAKEQRVPPDVSSWQSYMSLLKIPEKPQPKVVPKWKLELASARGGIDARTRDLVGLVRSARTDMSRSRRVEDLCRHLQQHPEAINLAFMEGAVSCLLAMYEETSDKVVQMQLREALALLGYVRPVTGRGIRILSIDGGGIRGILAIELLRELERLSGQPVYQMFDLICGVSTGALLACLLGPLKRSLDEVEELYTRLGTAVFTQTRLKGTTKLLWEHSYYDTEAWRVILQQNLGMQPLIAFSRDQAAPKVAAVSTLVSSDQLQAFIFRSYNHPHHVQSHYQGSSRYKVWEAVQASAAAPGYFQECRIGDMLHQDGGILVNNPAAIAIHEARQLWPQEPLQCVVSIGTGRFAPSMLSTRPTAAAAAAAAPDATSWMTKIRKFVDSATDTEGVHTILTELLPTHSYFRLNPYLTENVLLDDSHPDKLRQLKEDARMYLRKNSFKLGRAVTELNRQRRRHQRFIDWIHLKRDTHGF
ncbi:calcium-independent phospholipase A2-gamma-like isoform X1 [Amphibalanus amphitrite]|uniref:calcium-independent phospholipase A2-gamma-like isoform X1 n=2 Tax=Amphibalanus amphitrite TaxID=1232801 RepID=UPI001C9050EF|nr:calcium-independent phospholipase A2-gamma-like isoform X1 [Amphibalanus amphitrite]XP_043241164.1 calcium-independent phospholipase A2-gamma-like isoform X1 [Amphibalanus amphitrite]XP_043241165.1 calcium-independent phospholipase A2-gamma-like isoform X1 [Amphibalanus amphitrite]XP_043241166.1 calcium-independent phospholipase A2-gamma-like isoform X1 [Amphibalanus amphitrite]